MTPHWFLRKNMHNKVLFQPLVICFSEKWLFSDYAIISIMNDENYGTTKKLMKSWDNKEVLFSLYLQRLGSYECAVVSWVTGCTSVSMSFTISARVSAILRMCIFIQLAPALGASLSCKAILHYLTQYCRPKRHLPFVSGLNHDLTLDSIKN